MKKQAKNHVVLHIKTIGVYAALSIFVLLPALRGGQLFLLDMPWPQHMQLSAYTAQGVPTHMPLLLVLWVLQLALPAFVLQKLLLLFLVFTAGYGMHVFLRALFKSKQAFSGGLLYACNPYILDRIYAGQWLVLAGYACLPIVAYTLLLAYKKPSRKSIAVAILTWALYATVSVHYWYMVTILLFPCVAYIGAKHIWPKKLYRHFKKSDIVLLACVVGVLGFVISRKYIASIQLFSYADFAAFATRPLESFGGFLTIISLRGFWYSDGLVPYALEAVWYGVCCILYAASWYAVYKLYKRSKLTGLYVFACVLCVTLLAVGYAGSATLQFTDAFRTVLPGFNGMRETQKFAGLLAGMYAVTATYFFAVITKKRFLKTVYIAVVALYAFSMCITVVANYSRLKTYNYPNEWQQVKSIVQSDQVSKVAVVPWDGYLYLAFAGNSYSANPAKTYFGSKAYSRNNADNALLDEARGLSLQDVAVLSVAKGESVTAVRQAGFSHILVLHTQDYLSYLKNLQASTQVELVFKGDSLSLYAITQ